MDVFVAPIFHWEATLMLSYLDRVPLGAVGVMDHSTFRCLSPFVPLRVLLPWGMRWCLTRSLTKRFVEQ
jgi:hypothetical protein